MPGLYHEPISRKEFLKTTARFAGAAALAATTETSQAEEAESSASSLRVALLADTHIPADAADEYRGFRPVENLRQVIPQVVAAGPAMAFIVGDAARLAGHLGDYQALKELLRPIAMRLPVHIGLGNHDDRTNFYEVFPAQHGASPVADKHVTVVDRAGIRFVLLDSLLYVDKVAGLLGKAQREWLEAFLNREEKKPTVLLVHHTLGDADGDLLDVDRLFRIVSPHQHVKAILYGHSHRYVCDRYRHMHLINLPAVGYNFADREPVGWIDAVFTPRGVDLTLQAIAGNQANDGQTTSLEWA